MFRRDKKNEIKIRFDEDNDLADPELDAGNSNDVQESESGVSDEVKQKDINRGWLKPVIILAVILVVAVSATTVLIFLNRDDDGIGDLDSLNEIMDEDSFKVASLTEMYVANSLVCVSDAYEIGSDNLSDMIFFEGLKNKEVQNKINDKVREAVRITEDSSGEVIYVSLSANFGDIISINIYGNDKNTYLNLRLDNGEDIKFNDIFVSGTNIKSIVSNALYRHLAINSQYADYNGSIPDASKHDFSDVEEKTLKMMLAFEEDENPKFLLSPEATLLCIGEEEVWIDLYKKEVYQKVAIYKRFKSTDGLYEKDLGLQPAFVFNDFGPYIEYTKEAFYKFGYVEDNMFVNAYIEVNNDYGNEKAREVIEEKRKDLAKEINAKISELRSVADSNKNKAYVLIAKVIYEGDIIMHEEYTSMPEVQKVIESVEFLVLEMTKDHYDNVFSEIFADNFIQKRGGGLVTPYVYPRIYENDKKIKTNTSGFTRNYSLEGDLISD
jgi:hypothetical protein